MMFKWGRKFKIIFLSLIVICFIIYISHTYIENKALGSFEVSVMKWFNYTEDNLNGESILMDDPKLIQKLRYKFLLPPPPFTSDHKYKLSEPLVEDTSMGQAKQIRSILKDKKNGFFIECGALDGETRSNTLYLERFLNWTGLLIEADPLNFAQMLGKNRRAWLSPTCISIKRFPEIVSFKQNNNMGKISNKAKGTKLRGYIDVQCFPIYTFLLALNITRVDYFSLDIEGGELDALQNLPFDKVDIQTLSVEFVHVTKGEDALKDFMESKGYKVHSKVTHPNWLANDFIFLKS